MHVSKWVIYTSYYDNVETTSCQQPRPSQGRQVQIQLKRRQSGWVNIQHENKHFAAWCHKDGIGNWMLKMEMMR